MIKFDRRAFIKSLGAVAVLPFVPVESQFFATGGIVPPTPARYVVFENLPLGPFDNRIPEMASMVARNNLFPDCPIVNVGSEIDTRTPGPTAGAPGSHSYSIDVTYALPEGFDEHSKLYLDGREAEGYKLLSRLTPDNTDNEDDPGQLSQLGSTRTAPDNTDNEVRLR